MEFSGVTGGFMTKSHIVNIWKIAELTVTCHTSTLQPAGMSRIHCSSRTRLGTSVGADALQARITFPNASHSQSQACSLIYRNLHCSFLTLSSSFVLSHVCRFSGFIWSRGMKHKLVLTSWALLESMPSLR
jgi:hypothetical protein